MELPKIVFLPVGQPPRTVEAAPGATVMEVARDAGVPGIVGDCGGEMSCGTCHGRIEEAFLGLLPPPSDDEQVMLEDGIADPQPDSRLCCQIIVTDALDGMTVTVPRQF